MKLISWFDIYSSDVWINIEKFVATEWCLNTEIFQICIYRSALNVFLRAIYLGTKVLPKSLMIDITFVVGFDQNMCGILAILFNFGKPIQVTHANKSGELVATLDCQSIAIFSPDRFGYLEWSHLVRKWDSKLATVKVTSQNTCVTCSQHGWWPTTVKC